MKEDDFVDVLWKGQTYTVKMLLLTKVSTVSFLDDRYYAWHILLAIGEHMVKRTYLAVTR